MVNEDKTSGTVISIEERSSNSNTLGNMAHDHDVGSSSDIVERRGYQVEVHGRMICIFRHDGNLYALDLHCYHMGGPLATGDIEELVLERPTGRGEEVHPCVVCPWHKYKISLKTGEGIYRQTDPFSATKECVIKSRGQKQRTHEVFEENGRVIVRLNLSEERKYESDYYESEEFRALMSRHKGR
jgi:nitrite reductase/ring-hydroxylating ferredoxin subunit